MSSVDLDQRAQNDKALGTLWTESSSIVTASLPGAEPRLMDQGHPGSVGSFICTLKA